MQYYAHSVEGVPKSEWQLLRDHAQDVAKRAAELAKPLGLERAAFIAGLLHDLGKYTPEFQRRLDGANIRVDHSTAGAQVLCECAKGNDRVMADIIAYAILGHHAGLPDRMEGASSYDRRMERKAPLDAAWQAELTPDVSNLMPELVRRFPQKKDFSLAFMGRMIFSCLVDADFKDTEAFYARHKGESPPRDWARLPDLLPDFLARFEARMAAFSTKESDLNRLRREVLTHLRGKAGESPGFFTLTVPTGGGKTLASLGFALDHAKHHGHRRIIYAIPFTSIIDQTARIFQDLLGEGHVLEHHSVIEEKEDEPVEKKSGAQKDKLRLAMEDWAAPVIVTTNVQLFESLFASRTSRARKLHNIAGSIIILDEAQTLPRGLLFPVLRVLEELANHYGCTIIICTATQPAFGKREDFPKGLQLEGRELAPDPEGLAKRLARTHLRHGGAMENAALVTALEAHDQALVIVNSRKHALELYQDARAAGLEGLIHLSTRQYAAQRSVILADVRTRLKDHRPCRLIATSLIEAGVDVDFPIGFRAEAGLDQIIQAAGRVNREGERLREESIVTIFTAPDYPPPGEIRDLISDMKRMIDKHDDLTSLAAIEHYFREVYWKMDEKLDKEKILEKFTWSDRSGSCFNYRTVAEKFRMIESGLAPVIVAREEKARDAVKKLGIEAIPSGTIARDLQRFIVLVPPKAREKLITCGHAAYAEAKLRGDQFVVLNSMSLYQDDVGLLWDDAEYLALENSIT